MFIMSEEDFSYHTTQCEKVSGMSLSSLPRRFRSFDELTCECWDEFEWLEDVPTA